MPQTPASAPSTPATADGARPRLADLVRDYVAEQCRVLLAADEPLREGKDVTHRTRVAARRLRSVLRVFEELVDADRAGHLDGELVWWAGLLGVVRDSDVLAARLTGLVADLPADLVLGPVAERIQAALGARRDGGRQAVLAALESERFAALRAELTAWRDDPPLTGAADVKVKQLHRYVGRAEKKLHRRLDQAVAAQRAGLPEAGDLLHRARKASKRYRYACELAVPVWGARAERQVAWTKDLQDLLGDRQDGEVSVAFLRELAAETGSRSGHNAFTYGILHAQEHALAESVPERLAPFLDRP